MGNQGTCSRLCEKGNPADDHNHDDFLNTQILVPCQICQQQFKHQALNHHIDQKHYATIKEEQTGTVAVQCLLCSKALNDLLQQGKHLQEKHPYALNNINSHSRTSTVVIEDARASKIVGQEQLNKNKKANLVKLENQSDFQILKKIDQNKFEAAIKGHKYQVATFSKEYRGAQYYEQLVLAELVYFNVFRSRVKCKYYYLDLDAGKRNILCKAYLFMATHS